MVTYIWLQTSDGWSRSNQKLEHLRTSRISLSLVLEALWGFFSVWASLSFSLGFPGGSDGKESAAVWETWVQPLAWEDPLEKGTAAHSSILAWRIPWTEEPGGCSPWGHRESDMTE